MKRDSPIRKSIGVITTLNDLSKDDIVNISRLMKDGKREKLRNNHLVCSIG